MKNIRISLVNAQDWALNTNITYGCKFSIKILQEKYDTDDRLKKFKSFEKKIYYNEIEQ